MRTLRELLFRFNGLFGKQRKDRELDEEIGVVSGIRK